MSDADPIRLTRVEAEEHYKLRLTYADGVMGLVDLSHLTGKGVFRLWDDPAAYERVTIGTGGELHWSDDVELCADSLYMEITGEPPRDG